MTLGRGLVDVKQTGQNLAFRTCSMDRATRRQSVRRIPVRLELVQVDRRAVVQRELLNAARLVRREDLTLERDEIDRPGDLCVLANVVVRLCRSDVVVESFAGRDDIQESETLMFHRGFDEGDELLLVAAKTLRDKRRPKLDRETREIDRLK